MLGVTITRTNSAGYAREILERFGSKGFNVSVISMALGDETPSDHQKLRDQEFTGQLIERDGVVSLPMFSSQRLTWDLNIEQVIIYETSDELCIYRFVENRSRYLLYILTTNPI